MNEGAIIGLAITTITGLLTFLGKGIFSYFTKKLDQRDLYFQELIAQQQKNTENFVTTINHNQTKANASIDQLSRTIREQTDFFKAFLKM